MMIAQSPGDWARDKDQWHGHLENHLNVHLPSWRQHDDDHDDVDGDHDYIDDDHHDVYDDHHDVYDDHGKEHQWWSWQLQEVTTITCHASSADYAYDDENDDADDVIIDENDDDHGDYRKWRQ